MTYEILSNQAGITDVYNQVNSSIDELRRTASCIENVGSSALCDWKGRNADAFESLMNDMTIIATVLIEEAQAINQSMLESSEAFKLEDQLLADSYGG